jgi:AraC-like DNA-binding protein
MAKGPISEKATFWHASDVGHLELLKAHYISHTFPKHVHEGYVFGVIEKGVESFYAYGRLYHAPAGHIVIINPDTVHTGHSGHESGWIYRTLYPGKDLITGIARQIGLKNSTTPYFPEPVIHDPWLANRIRRLHIVLEHSASSLTREILFTETMAQVLMRHARPLTGNPPVHRQHHAIKTVMEYMDAHFGENISLKSLAHLVNLSPFYLTRLFRQEIGISPHKYLTQLRINKARTMLIDGGPLADVAYRTGFSDQSHFTRHFKRIVGVTPGRYTP